MSRSTTATRWTGVRAITDLERLALRAPAREEFFDEAAARLKKAVPFDSACWHTLDPGSDLITQHRLQNLPDRFPVLANNEYAVDDVNKFEQLARADRKAATLSEATGGHPERSARFRDLLTRVGLGPELRCSFVTEGSMWGAVILLRRAGEPDFEPRDVELLSRASPLFARAVRRGLVAEASQTGDQGSEAPGVVELDASGEATGASSSAERLLEELSGTTAEAGLRAASLHAVASATRAATVGGGSASRPLPASAVKTPGGTWLVLHGSLLGSTADQRVAVFMQRAHPTLVAPLLLRAFGLTPREEDVTQLVLRGATTAQLAQRLEISPHTVNDHLKNVFEKTGARTRGELSATLFFGEHLPRIQRQTPIGDDASFLDAPRPRGQGDPAIARAPEPA